MSRRLAQLAAIPVTQLVGVGEKRADALAKLDLRTVLDLLTYYPRRYLDRTNERRIDELDVGEEAMVLASVKAVSARRTKSRKTMVTVDLTDGSGFLRATFFNQPYRERQLKPGMSTVLFGKVEIFNGRRQMTNPVVDLIGDKTGRIVPAPPPRCTTAASRSTPISSASSDRRPGVAEAIEREPHVPPPRPARRDPRHAPRRRR